MAVDIAPKDRFGGWDDYFETMRRVDRLVDAGELTAVPVEGQPPAYHDVYFFEDNSGGLWRLGEPEPPAAGSWGPVDELERQGTLWECAIRSPSPVRFFRTWGEYLEFRVWIEKMVEARELISQDSDADLTAFGSTHVLVDRDGEIWELHVPHPGADDFGSFSRRV